MDVDEALGTPTTLTTLPGSIIETPAIMPHSGLVESAF